MNQRATPFPPEFFLRADEQADDVFYEPLRLVTHIDDGAVAAVGGLYQQLDVTGDVLDLMSSWVSHLRTAPASLTVLGMNAAELNRNAMADHVVVHDLNTDPCLPFGDGEFDDATCCVSIDYLVRPVEVFTEVARVVRPGGRFVVTFSNRCFPTKAIRGWLANDDRGRLAIVHAYFEQSGAFEAPTAAHCNPGAPGDPLYAVWATTTGNGSLVRADGKPTSTGPCSTR